MLDKSEMLNQIKQHYGFETDAKFAAFLGIRPQVFSNWKGRNTFDAELVYRRCPELNPAWLLCQEGDMLAEPHQKAEEPKEDPTYLLQKEVKVLEKHLLLLKESHKSLEESEAFFLNAIKSIKTQIEEKRELLKNA
ncbi:helix-turn-helix domain-containing protein [Mesonia aquimarina]|uniref:helix-turn-helix domain-containing protein n=1 Tax=Mesonia aquimarina TaxID=1504967 RepID=UPI000EF5780A|nr:helix-turn-helix domain-containing protein [Mesonia aquimarina]